MNIGKTLNSIVPGIKTRIGEVTQSVLENHNIESIITNVKTRTVSKDGLPDYVDKQFTTINEKIVPFSELPDYIQKKLYEMQKQEALMDMRKIESAIRKQERAEREESQSIFTNKNSEVEQRKPKKTIMTPLKKKYLDAIFLKPFLELPMYRVIGKQELNSLLAGKEIVGKNSMARYGRPCVDVSTSGCYHEMMFGEEKFRITFPEPTGKTEEERMNQVINRKIYQVSSERQHYQIPSYNINDIDKSDIRKWNGYEWQPVKIENLK